MKTYKCVVWDLDNTLWDGTLLEGDCPIPRPGVVAMIEDLDRRGVLHSISSRNERADAMRRLDELGLAGYFVAPQIDWNSKSSHIGAISRALGLSPDSFALIDDDPFERAEVASVYPAVSCYEPGIVGSYRDVPSFVPAVITPEAAKRRLYYQAEDRRREAHESSGEPLAAFLARHELVFDVRRASLDDIARVRELAVRTNQLNTTGIVYTEAELVRLVDAPDHEVLVAAMDDRFGSYGTIGVAVVRKQPGLWVLSLLLTSCRVISRGAGSVFLREMMKRAHAARVRLMAEMIPTGRNRAMLVALRFAGFQQISGAVTDGPLLFEADTSRAPEFPAHVTVRRDSSLG